MCPADFKETLYQKLSLLPEDWDVLFLNACYLKIGVLALQTQISPVSIKGPSWPATTATASCILVHCQCTAEHLAACCRGVQLRNDTHRMDTHCQRLCDNLAGPTSGPNTLFTTMPLYAGEHALRDGLYVDRESLCTMGYVARSTYAMRVSTTCLDNTDTNICTHQSASPLHRSLTHVSEVPTNADA